MSRPARITVHSAALKHNLQIAKQTAPLSKVMVAVKADAYGHGMLNTASVLQDEADGFIVACMSEALQLREAGVEHELAVIQGAQSLDDLKLASEKGIRLIFHDAFQFQLLDRFNAGKRKLKAALKLDTGMHRLGLPASQAAKLFARLQSHSAIHPDTWLMTHLACADELTNQYTNQQVTLFDQFTEDISAPKTIANSAGILGWTQTHRDWVRPGIMIYGSSPFADRHRDDLGLKATMSLAAPLIAVHDLQQGDAIGYGSTWTCPQNMSVGVISCGYADGYPRHAKSGTSIWINGKTSKLLGRVSMDLIVIDLSDVPAKPGDMAELWGKNINIDDVASSAETIGYELYCHAGKCCKKTFEPS